MVWHENRGGVQAGSFCQQVVVILGAGVSHGGRNPGGVLGDGLRKTGGALRRSLRGSREDLPDQAKRHQAQGNLLSRRPVRAQVSRIRLQEGFSVAPE